ncbi:hypothetical protein D3C85_1771380 [compost metagenome]
MNRFLAQEQSNVVIERISQGESNQCAQWLIAASNRQEFMEAFPVERTDMNPEFAAAITNVFA